MAKALAKIGFRDRGEFAPNTEYKELDSFRYKRSTYFAKKDFTSGATFEETADNVQVLADATGVEEATEAATAAAELANQNGTEAGVQAEAAKSAAEEAEKQAATAKETTDVFGSNFKKIVNDKYTYAIGDLIGNVLWAIMRGTGEVYQPKGMPEAVKAALAVYNERIGDIEKRLHLVENPNYLFAIADSKNNLLFALNRKGGAIVNALTIGNIVTVEKGDYKGYALVIQDTARNLLFGLRWDGTVCCSKFELPNAVWEQIKAVAKNKNFSVDENDMEFIFRIQTPSGAILQGWRWDGSTYTPKGIPEDQKKVNRNVYKEIKTLKARIADFHGGTGDWSEAGGCQIPIPRCAMVNFITSTMPTAKSGMGTSGVNCDIPCYMEFWDRQGNYFKIPILLSAQGNSSMAFAKKNLAIDLFTDASREDSYVVKFGDWVAQDSFHLKAYYTDTFRGVGAVSYMLYEEMVKTRDLCDDRPYKASFTKNYTMSDQGNSDSNANLDENFDTGAKCFPQGFPCVVMQNGEFYGLYSFQLKKHRDNMHQNKKTAEHIHLDGTLGAASIWGGVIDWTRFEVRNPKSLYMQEKQTIRGEETQEYNGDYPREIMGEDSEAYDKSNKDMKRCAKVKKYIQDLSERIPELQQAEKDGKTNDEMRALIAKYFMPSFMVDYILETNLVSDGDGYNKNWQWTTWDGILWVANPYDHDGIFGAYHIGNYVGGPSSGWLGNSTTIPSGWIIKYYMPELKARWAELRKAGIFDAKHIAKLLWDWCDRFGYDMWEQEYNKWNESPCYRPSLINTDYWTRTTGYINGWTAATTYAKGDKVSKGGKAYNSLVANNIGIDPTTDDGTKWENVTYDETKEYAVNDTCYYGSNNFYGFKAVQTCQGQPPLTGFYNLYPKELGHYDSVYRVENWLKQRIAYMDKLLDYTEAA